MAMGYAEQRDIEYKACEIAEKIGHNTYKAFGTIPRNLLDDVNSFPLIKQFADTFVEFYPNILISRVHIHTPGYRCAYRSTVHMVANDLENPVSAIKWSNENMVATLSKTKQLTYPKFIREFTKKELSSDVVRDIGAKLRAALKPKELQFAKSVDDYIRMYNDAYSCAGLKRMNVKHLVDNKTPPAMWIMYNPQLQGVFIEENGKVTARCVLCRKDADGAWTGHSTIYGSDTGRIELSRIMRSMGLHPNVSFKQNVSYRMPACRYTGITTLVYPICPFDPFTPHWYHYEKEPYDPDHLGWIVIGPRNPDGPKQYENFSSYGMIVRTPFPFPRKN